jgi:hypothetical protein
MIEICLGIIAGCQVVLAAVALHNAVGAARLRDDVEQAIDDLGEVLDRPAEGDEWKDA